MHKDREEMERVKQKRDIVLVVEDEDILLEVTKISLEMNGYSVLSARDGVEAIKKFLTFKDSISTVICDLNMPHLDGKSALQSIVALKPNVKVIIVSGSVGIEKIKDFDEFSSAVFLQKPYRSEILIKSLKNLLRKNPVLANS